MRRREVLALPAAVLAQRGGIAIRGAYSSPKTFWERGRRLDEYGINALFVGSGAIGEDLIRRARSEGARVYAEFAAWNGSAAPPQALPVDAEGKISPQQTWFQGICPTYEPFLEARLAALEQLVAAHRLDGVFLDYLHWHAQFEDPAPGLPETCFNASCLERFRRDTGVRAFSAAELLGRHQREWRDWRCSLVVDFARRCRKVLERHAPGALLGNYHCAWRDDEHGGARRRILGLDAGALDETFDVLSPMVYHGRSGRPVAWVRENVEWWSRRTRRARIWPIVQAHEVPAAEFDAALRAGLAGRASGVMMFTLGSVAADPEKLAVVKSVYRGPAA